MIGPLVLAEYWIFERRIFVAGVVKKRHEFIILVMLERIVRMTMTLHTIKAGTHYSTPGGVYAVKHGSGSILFIVGATFVIVHGVSVKRSSDVIGVGRVW